MEGKPLVIDLFCGLGGWAEGFLSEGYDVVGFDIERRPYPGQLVLQDVLTLHGSQFRNAAVIVASPPCQEFSRFAMPFGSLWLEHNRMDDDGAPAGNYAGKNPVDRTLFARCFTLREQASDASGRYIPLLVENVRGAQRWVGRARWSFGSYFLWGDVPALMPTAGEMKAPGNGSWFQKDNPKAFCHRGKEGVKFGGTWWNDSTNNLIRKASSGSPARKAASAEIAKIPFPLSQHIARVFKPSAQTT